MDPIIDFLAKDPVVVYLVEHPFVILLLFGLLCAAAGHVFMSPKPYRG